jgi:Putative peptidoglycan binding domain/D-alanyl-D-alanine carboxypeptidase
MPQLNGTVGTAGRNDRNDVVTVQTLLKARGVDPGNIDGRCGPKTILAITTFQTHSHLAVDGRVDPNGPTWKRLTAPAVLAATFSQWSGDSSQWPQEKKLRSLETLTRLKVQRVLGTLAAKGFQPKIFFAWRSVQVQEELFKKGRTKVHFSFHNAQRPDGTPNAYAADIIDARWGWEPEAEKQGFWTALGEAAKAEGLVWGGSWTDFKDEAHVQNRQNSELAAVKRESGL